MQAASLFGLWVMVCFSAFSFQFSSHLLVCEKRRRPTQENTPLFKQSDQIAECVAFSYTSLVLKHFLYNVEKYFKEGAI